MAIDPLLLSMLQALKYVNGACVIVACTAAGVLISSRARPWPAALPLAPPSLAAFFPLAALGFAYTFYPNFLDHAEPAMAMLGISMASYYAPGVPMFSDALRATFARRYAKIAAGAWYDTYACADGG